LKRLVESLVRGCRLPGVFLALFLFAGCATETRELLRAAPEGLPRRAELVAVPFFAQERYQCGPAALAMLLRSAGIEATPERLVSQVYVPEKEGSLPPEMLAAGRRNGALSMLIPPRLDALLAEMAAGNPVLVLQNLGLSWLPRWHYAVVIGYDLDREEVILRSGLEARLVLPMSTFEHTWGRGGHWGMVTLTPGRLPRTAKEVAAVSALVALERVVPPAQARLAYGAALERWPGSLALLMGLGNANYALGERAAAAEAFRQATLHHPQAAAAYNNLAVVLVELGRAEEARGAVEKALALGGPAREAALETLRSIEAMQERRP
jgi:tetratricopeptide (TPR) repeat protein